MFQKKSPGPVMSLVCMGAKSLQSRLTLQPQLQPARLLCPWASTGKNTGVGCHAPLQGVFPTHGSPPCLFSLLHWQAGPFFFFFFPINYSEVYTSVALTIAQSSPLSISRKFASSPNKPVCPLSSKSPFSTPSRSWSAPFYFLL